MPPIRMPARNIVQLQRLRQGTGWYVERIEDAKLKDWRKRLADGSLKPDHLTSDEREQLQAWILEHPEGKPTL